MGRENELVLRHRHLSPYHRLTCIIEDLQLTSRNLHPARLNNNTSKVKQPAERANIADIKRVHPSSLYSISGAAIDGIDSNNSETTYNMTKLIFACIMLVGCVSAARLDHLVPSGYAGGRGGPDATPFHFENVNNGDGNYRYSYDTPEGISAHETGSPRAQGPEGPAVTAEGGFSFHTPDGQHVQLTYTADENGFHPTGSHIPTPPPIPEAILRSLEYNRQNPSPDSGSFNAGAGGRNYY
ncbi:unnamed protein product [Arctia plantaginis]|uniref:Pupal cuticle protein 20-like n=1 Tax=Arctia plantaginis TaxID=874455 RepID=A0A8S0ZAN9_ARCPL|nr:unnamed protein product [Arctia plantaginis]